MHRMGKAVPHHCLCLLRGSVGWILPVRFGACKLGWWMPSCRVFPKFYNKKNAFYD